MPGWLIRSSIQLLILAQGGDCTVVRSSPGLVSMLGADLLKILSTSLSAPSPMRTLSFSEKEKYLSVILKIIKNMKNTGKHLAELLELCTENNETVWREIK